MKKNKEISRRKFTRDLAKLLLFGGLTHFNLKSSAYAASSKEDAYTDCPGGMSPTDICNPPIDRDYCPGQMAPADECPQDGNREEDECSSGLAEADICDPTVKGASVSDTCTSGDSKNDDCPEDDKCWSGTVYDDHCPPDHGLAAGDACPGGGSRFRGMALDVCVPEGSGPTGGDECPPATWSLEDDCKDTEPDRCLTSRRGIKGWKDDDTCLTGKNHDHTRRKDGPDDWCRGSFLSSDSCWSGKDEDDLCIDNGGDNGEFDECPGGDRELDKCGPVGQKWWGGTINSDDYCVSVRNDSDECPEGMPPEDECPGGVASEDICYKHVAGSDECDSKIAGSDQGGCKRWLDECFISDKCGNDRSQDIAE